MSKLWLAIVCIPLLIAILTVNLAFNSDNKTSLEKARNTALAGNYARAERIYDELLKFDSLDIELHRNKISSHFNSPKKIGKSSYRDDDKIVNKYKFLTRSKNLTESSIGFYGLGYIEIQLNNLDKALEYYLKADYQHLPFISNSIGYVYLKHKDYINAEQFFKYEIHLGGNLAGAYSNLALLLQETSQVNKLNTMLQSAGVSKYISERVYRYHYFETGQIKEYATYLLKLGNFTTTGLIGAILILIVWLIFLIWIDVFEAEKIRHVLLALLLGAFFSTLCKPLYDFYYLKLGWELNGNYLNDLLYCIFSIGLIEETVKFVPFLILLNFKNIINESMDYIVYASICALGFAFMENLLYFHESGLDNMVSRSLSATVLHMTLTTFVAYGLMYAKYKRNVTGVGYLCLSFFLACVIHGIYDFWLVSDGWVGDLRIFSVLILIYAVQRYAVAISNALSHSEFNQGSGRLVRSAEYLVFALSFIAAYQYAVIGYEYGSENANMNLFAMLLSSTFLAYMLVVQLGDIQVVNGRWISILKIIKRDEK